MVLQLIVQTALKTLLQSIKPYQILMLVLMALVSTPTFVFSSYKDLFISLSLFIISSILGYFFMGICNAVYADTVFNILVPYLNYYDFVNTFYNDFVHRNIIHD